MLLTKCFKIIISKSILIRLEIVVLCCVQHQNIHVRQCGKDRMNIDLTVANYNIICNVQIPNTKKHTWTNRTDSNTLHYTILSLSIRICVSTHTHRTASLYFEIMSKKKLSKQSPFRQFAYSLHVELSNETEIHAINCTVCLFK